MNNNIMIMRRHIYFLALFSLGCWSFAADSEAGQHRPEASSTPVEEALQTADLPGYSTGFRTDLKKRIVELSIPAPRGLIIDRNGKPLAQNMMANYVGIQFPNMDEKSDDEIVAFALQVLKDANQALGTQWTFRYKQENETEEEYTQALREQILDHYKKKGRRFSPMIFSPRPLTDEQLATLEEISNPALRVLPTYQRFYPNGTLAAHLLGYTGARPPWPQGELQEGEDLWPVAQGMAGLEKMYDAQLTGKPGKLSVIFDETGKIIQQTIVRKPIPGNTIVTTLDLDLQKNAEKSLAEGAKRGAAVFTDVNNGDVLAMASYPSYDPNVFIPRVSSEDYDKLLKDPERPLFNRAAKGVYPPASTFKVVAALGMLEGGKISEDTIFEGASSFSFGNNTWRNWNTNNEGPLNVVGALARSTNTWFYPAILQSGTEDVMRVAGVLGYGDRPGVLPSEEESNGSFIEPNTKIPPSEALNLTIGQGSAQVSPLQNSLVMAGVANGKMAPFGRLVSSIQAQTLTGAQSVVQSFDPDGVQLNFNPKNLALVHKGMRDVVNHPRGTAGKAHNDRVEFGGKTGTGQEKDFVDDSQDVNIAWFAGFYPADASPKVSYAIVYEGDPGEKVGGGSKAAPILGQTALDYLTDERLGRLSDAGENVAGYSGEAQKRILASRSEQDAMSNVYSSSEGDPVFLPLGSQPNSNLVPAQTEKTPKPQQKRRGLLDFLRGRR